jgi:hypothetical protein
MNACAPKVTCNSPYIQVGTSCCLDQNNNQICDNDEEIKTSLETADAPIEKEVTINSNPKVEGDIFDGELYQIALTENDLGSGEYFFNRVESGTFTNQAWASSEDQTDFVKLAVENKFIDGLYLTYHQTTFSGTKYVNYRTIRFGNIENAKTVFAKQSELNEVTPQEMIDESSTLTYRDTFFSKGVSYGRKSLNFRTGDLISFVQIEAPKEQINESELKSYVALINDRILDKTKRLKLSSNPYPPLEPIISSVSNTQNNIGVTLYDFSFEDKGTWGKINTMKIGVTNDAPEDFYPVVRIYVYDKENPSTSDKTQPKDTFETGGLGSGYTIDELYNTKVSFSNIENIKIVQVTVGDLFGNPTLVSVEKEVNFKELS